MHVLRCIRPLLAGLLLVAQAPVFAGVSDQVDALFAPFNEGVRPGAAVMIIRNGEIVHSAGYGYANLAEEIPVTPASTFRLASVSKQFTAMAVMILAERGKLDYDDPVARYVPELTRFEGITVRHLLTHTGGLPDYYDDVPLEGPRPSNADAMQFLSGWGEALFAPGEKYEYSNPGYEALAQVVEAASGRPFSKFMREAVFVPAGMQDSLVHDHRWPTVPRRVLGYAAAEDGDGFVLEDDHHLNGITGSGSQYSTLDDFYHWDRALCAATLVGQDTLEAAFTRARLNNGEEIEYGFGWRLDEHLGQRRIAHGGSWVGFRTSIARYPDAGLTVVVLMNFAEAEPEKLGERVAEIYLGAGPDVGDPASG